MVLYWAKKPGWYGSLLDANIERVLQGDHSCIAVLFCVFAEDHAPSKEKAAKALLQLLEQMQFDDISRTDMRMRDTSSMEWNINWREKRLDDFFTRGMTEDERRAVTIFASFNPNGYTREQAVWQMAKTGRTLPYILLRQNDWVQQVRYAAARAFDERLQDLSEGELVEALPFAEKLKRSSRGSHGEYTERFFALLCAPQHRKDLQAGLRDGHVRTRRICIEAMLAMPAFDEDLIRQHLQVERDPFLRGMLFRGLVQKNAVTPQLAEDVRGDKYPLNRLLALQYFEKTERAAETAYQMLPDKNAVVRGEARRIMQSRQPQFDALAYYKDRRPTHPETSIYGIGETGGPAECALLEGYLQDARSAIVRAAMVGLMRLDCNTYALAIMELLADERSGVVKTAQRLLRKNGVPDFARLWEIMEAVPSERTKLTCLPLLETDAKWSRLIWLLRALRIDSALLRVQVLSSLERWAEQFNRSFALASRRQEEEIRALLAENTEHLPPGLMKRLRFLCK